MKIGINLVGVSYNNAKEGGRLRNYEDAIENFHTYIVEPLREKGHEVQFYLYSYENEKQDKIVNDYIPCIKSQFVKPDYMRLCSNTFPVARTLTDHQVDSGSQNGYGKWRQYDTVECPS